MAKHLIFILTYISCMGVLLFLSGCEPKLEGKPVNLELNDPRPILSVQVADADEARLLAQKLRFDIVRIEGHTVFFYEDAKLLPDFVALGYELEKKNAYDVFRRVVRINRTVPETELLTNGVRVINREKDYLIVEASIGVLRALKRNGAQMVTIQGNEPKPRPIRIVVKSTKDVARIGAMAIDIYSAKPEAKKPEDKKSVDSDKVSTLSDYAKRKIVVNGGAFDFQIDQLKQAGYSVEILPVPKPRIQGDSDE